MVISCSLRQIKKGKRKKKSGRGGGFISNSNYQMKPLLNGHFQRAWTPLCVSAFSLRLLQLPADNLIILADKTIFFGYYCVLALSLLARLALRIVKITE